MSRHARVCPAGYAYHVMNRGAFQQELFATSIDYQIFEELIFLTQEKIPIRICAYCIMPNHWHLVLWPSEDKQLSQFMHCLTSTHVQKIKKHWEIKSLGSIYQGRYKSCLVESSEYYLNLVKYVEANPLRAKLVARAENWTWSSLPKRLSLSKDLSPFSSPIKLPKNWVAMVNQDLSSNQISNLRNSINKGSPYGEKSWISQISETLNLSHTLNMPGRPRSNS